MLLVKHVTGFIVNIINMYLWNNDVANMFIIYSSHTQTSVFITLYR